jgi:hypothetical protein
MTLAIKSLPVPLSPWMRIGVASLTSLDVILRTKVISSVIRGEGPTTEWLSARLSI